MSENWKIIYFSLKDNPSPVFEFIESLPDKAIGKLTYTFNLLMEFGPQIKSEHFKKVTGTPLWELRILGENNIRIFYIPVENRAILFLHGFIKKKQKTPHKEIVSALKRWGEYQVKIK